jgi:hypothetical protein
MSRSEIWKISKGSDLSSHIRYFEVRDLTSYLMKQEIMLMLTHCGDLVIIARSITETFCHNLEGVYNVFDDAIIMLILLLLARVTLCPLLTIFDHVRWPCRIKVRVSVTSFSTVVIVGLFIGGR